MGGQFARELRIVLRGADFRRLYVTRLSSQTADGMFEAALASLFFFSPQRAATAQGIAAAFAVAILPYTVVGPFAGVLLDRWSRRQVLVRTNVIRAALVVGVALLVGSGRIGPGLYLLVLTCLSLNRFFLAGLGASLPHVVDADELVMANAVSPTSGTVVALAGTGIAVTLRQVFGAGDHTDGGIVALAASLYLCSALLARRMSRDLLGPDAAHRLPWRDLAAAARDVGRGLVAAARHLHRRRPAFDALAVMAGQRFAYGMVTVAMILLCRATFADPADPDAGAVRLAAAFAVSGAGFFAAAVITPAVTHRISLEAWITTCCALAAGLAVLFAAVLTYPLALAAGFAVGIAMQGTKICVDSIVQRTVDDAYRGRAMSFYDMLFNITFVSAAAVCALTLPPSGHSPALFVVVSLVYLASGLGYHHGRHRDPSPM